MWVFKDEGIGTIYNEAYIDGYVFGDRLLEGVMFKITIDENKQFHAKFAWPDGYTEGLNETYWCKEAKECASTRDVFSSGLSRHSTDIFVYDTETNEYCPNVI